MEGKTWPVPPNKRFFAINPKEWDAYLPVSPKSFSSSDLGKEDLPTNVTFNSRWSQLLRQLPGLNLRHRSVMKMHQVFTQAGEAPARPFPQAHGFGLARAGFVSWRPFRLNQCQVGNTGRNKGCYVGKEWKRERTEVNSSRNRSEVLSVF